MWTRQNNEYSWKRVLNNKYDLRNDLPKRTKTNKPTKRVEKKNCTNVNNNNKNCESNTSQYTHYTYTRYAIIHVYIDINFYFLCQLIGVLCFKVYIKYLKRWMNFLEAMLRLSVVKSSFKKKVNFLSIFKRLLIHQTHYRLQSSCL